MYIYIFYFIQRNWGYFSIVPLFKQAYLFIYLESTQRGLTVASVARSTAAPGSSATRGRPTGPTSTAACRPPLRCPSLVRTLLSPIPTDVLRLTPVTQEGRCAQI